MAKAKTKTDAVADKIKLLDELIVKRQFEYSIEKDNRIKQLQNEIDYFNYGIR